MKTVSRSVDLMKNKKPVKTINGELKQGSEFVIFENKFGFKQISCILNWKDGFLHSTPDTPAVQFDDSHTEYWENGKLSNREQDIYGNLMPAVISQYGSIEEYWVDGKRVD